MLVACRDAALAHNPSEPLVQVPLVAPGPSAVLRVPNHAVGPLPHAARVDPVLQLTPGGAGAARGRYGMVVSVEAQATRAGVQALEMGGNAIDAAVATAYALAVTHPSAGNLGGGGFMLISRRGEPIVALDFREQAPASIHPAGFTRMLRSGARGPAASAVPGSVAGLNLAQQQFGRLSRQQVLARAIELARNGHRVGSRQALALEWAWPELRQNDAARRIFGGARGPLGAGAELVQSDLARTLERISRDGDAGFYTGSTARALVQAMRSVGSIGESDLLDYRAIIRQPLRFTYRGYEIATMPPPSSGGIAIAQISMSLEQLGAERLAQGSAEELHLFAEVSKRAQAQRRLTIVDPESDPIGMSASALNERLALHGLLALTPPIDPKRATPSAEVHPLYEAARRELEHTTHLSVVDREGNAVSCTVTLSAGFGARYVAEGTGVVMNNSLAAFGSVGLNLPRPGRRMLSSMSPTFVMRNGDVLAVLGSPGGDTIPSTVVQVLRHLTDHGMSIDRAIEAPRIHHGFIPDELRYERSRPPDPGVLAALRTSGHTLAPTRAAIGAANDLIVVDGVAYGHADSREGGLALGPDAPPPAARR